MKITVRTGSRIHLGLIDPAGRGPGRRFGGAGLMVEEPAIVLRAERSERLEATGPRRP